MMTAERLRSSLAVLGGAVALLLSGPARPAAALAPPDRPELPGLPGIPDDQVTSADQLVRVRLESTADVVAPGETVFLAVVFTIRPGWHVYWEAAGAGGAPTEFKVRPPVGFVAGAARYPRPRAFAQPEGTEYGYERETVVFLPVAVPDDFDGDRIPVEVEVFYLVCRDRCLIGRVKRSIELATAPAERAGEILPPGDDERLRRYWQRLPRPLADLEGAQAQVRDGTLVVTGPAGEHDAVSFFPLDEKGVWFEPAHVEIRDGRFRLEVPYEVRWQNVKIGRTAVRGLVALGTGDDDPSYTVRIGLTAPTED